MTQPISRTPIQSKQTDPLVREVLSEQEFAALSAVETTPPLVIRKNEWSEDEARLKEEALCNALVEIEALTRTAAQAAMERAEKEHSLRSEIETLRRIQEQRLEEAYSERRGTHEKLWEEQTRLGQGTPQIVGGEFGHADEEARLRGEHLSPSAHFESPASETDFTPVPERTSGREVDLQRESLAGDDIESGAKTGIATPSEDLGIPADLIRRLNSDSICERSLGLSDLARLGSESAFQFIAQAFDEQSEDVRNAAARALFDLQPDRTASFARTLREGSPERRLRIGAALAASGIAGTAIGNLAGQTREKGYEAFSLLFLMTKAGEVQPLVRAVEDHPNIEVRLGVVKLLALSGEAEIIPSLRQLAVRGVLPSEVRAAVVEAIYELGRQISREILPGAKG